MQAIAEIKKFVKKIPGMKQALRSLDQFTAFATQLIKVTNDSSFVKKWQMERRSCCAHLGAPCALGVLLFMLFCVAVSPEILEEEGPKEVHEYILSLIARQEGMLQVLRLICLSCLCDGGFKSKVYDLYRRELVQTYGYEMLASLDNLRTLGLLKVKKGSNSWSNIRKYVCPGAWAIVAVDQRTRVQALPPHSGQRECERARRYRVHNRGLCAHERAHC